MNYLKTIQKTSIKVNVLNFVVQSFPYLHYKNILVVTPRFFVSLSLLSIVDSVSARVFLLPTHPSPIVSIW